MPPSGGVFAEVSELYSIYFLNLLIEWQSKHLKIQKFTEKKPFKNACLLTKLPTTCLWLLLNPSGASWL